jgi:DNA-binding MarR family transcriptional regulator
MATSERAALLARIASDQESMAMAMITHRLERLFANKLTAGQLHALVVLDTAGPQPASDLARALAISGATATGLVDRLVRDGLAERRPDPDDGRARVVHVTAAGVAAWRDALLGPTAIDKDVLARLSDDDLRLLARATEVMRRAVSDVTAQP